MTTYNNMFKKLSEMLKGDTPQQVNKILNEFGISKEEVIKQINNVNQEELMKKMNSKEASNMLRNLSPEEIDKIKNLKNIDELESLYKGFLKSKGDQ